MVPANQIEQWKAAKHGFDVWPDVLRYAEAKTPMSQIENADLERMKWHGVFYRKRDEPGHYMLRIRLTGCELTSEQAREIAYVAYEYGHGIIDITTRANVQVQGLALENVPRALARLNAVGLSARQTGHDNIRNVFGHPFSGLLPDELIDTRQLCHDITALFVDSRTYSDLPRKMNICVSGTAEHALHYWSQDISFLACATDEEGVLFQMLIGGTQGQNPQLGKHLPVRVTPPQVVQVTQALLDLFREQGSREQRGKARFRFLVERIGISGVLEYLEKHLPFSLRPCVAEPQPPSGYDELIGWFRQREPKLWTMGLAIPLGRLSWQQLEGLAVAAKRYGDGSLRVTHEQGIAICNLPAGFKDAAATAAAALGISLHADPLVRNTVACTGKQFCNIAVTDTKAHMFRLIEQLRKRALMLHGIRIHMSGCPSSCAQHFTADIGLKGVRVRRLLGTREGFDVYLGGGVSGQVHLGLLFRLGVDVDQLPQLVEEVVEEFYLKHRAGQTFSAYWREKLRDREASKVQDGEYTPPTWICDSCEYRHRGEDPPVFCPQCAGLRREFARLEDGEETVVHAGSASTSPATTSPANRADGFVRAIELGKLSDGAGTTVEVEGREFAFFRQGNVVHALDSACPHEGAPLAEGEFSDGVVTCPWHGWSFESCTGCSIEPKGEEVRPYETKIEEGVVLIRIGEDASSGEPPTADERPNNGEPPVSLEPPIRPSRPAASKSIPTARAATATLTISEILQETPDTKTFRLDNRAGLIPIPRPGQFLRLCLEIDGRQCWRSFTISSSPARPEFLDLTIKRNPSGTVSNILHDAYAPGDPLTVKGPQGAFYFDAERHTEPLLLISAGSGITPMMSILRWLSEPRRDHPCCFLYGARTPADIIFYDECREIARQLPRLDYAVTCSQPSHGWNGLQGRIDQALVERLVSAPAECRCFLCGPNDFMTSLQSVLSRLGVPPDRIHTEQFHTTPRAAVTG